MFSFPRPLWRFVRNFLFMRLVRNHGNLDAGQVSNDVKLLMIQTVAASINKFFTEPLSLLFIFDIFILCSNQRTEK